MVKRERARTISIKIETLDIEKLFSGSQEVEKIYDGTTEIYSSESELTALCFTANTAGSTVTLNISSGFPCSNTAYSTDGTTWSSYTSGTAITLTNVGDKVYFRSNVTGDGDGNLHMQFSMTGSIAASGTIMSMYDATNYKTLKTLTHMSCFIHLFRDCTALTTPPALPATTLSPTCYTFMFCGCTNLTTAPELPALSLPTNTEFYYGVYQQMFMNCTSLTKAPELPATSIGSVCYAYMFYGCTSLTTAPSILPATDLSFTPARITPDDGVYSHMFEGCINLKNAPQLPATTLSIYCYNSMFSSCSSLKIANNSATGTTQFLTCPATIPSNAVDYMFTGTGGTYTSNPVAGGTYYYYK